MHKDGDHAHNDFIKGLKAHQGRLASRACLSDSDADQYSEDNNLQHIAIRHGLDGVGGEYANQYIFKCGWCCRDIVGSRGGIYTDAGVNNIRQSQSNSDRYGSGK